MIPRNNAKIKFAMSS